MSEQERKICTGCGLPMLHVLCEDCDGAGGFWRGMDVWFPCRHCAGTGETDHCTNTDCPSIVWYPLSGSDAAILRMVKAKIGEDGR